MIAKNWLKMFWSHGVLLILNIWVVGIGRSCFDTLDPSATTTQIIVWALITYAYFKVAQKLDDMMQNSGMMITRTGGDFVHDATLAVGTIAATGKMCIRDRMETALNRPLRGYIANRRKSQQKTGGACCLSFSSTLLDKTKSVRYNVHKR